MIRDNYREKGSALMELCLVLPIIFMFLVGAIEFGKYFSQMSWLTQSGYNSALVAGETMLAERNAVLQDRFQRLQTVSEIPGLMTAGPTNPISIEYDVADPATARNFNARLTGTLQSRFFAFLPLDIPVRSVIRAPIMILGGTTGTTSGNFADPQFPFGCDSGVLCKNCTNTSPCDSETVHN